MAGHDEDRGQSILARISNEIVRLQKEFFGKGPTEAKSYVVDDILLVVLRGGLTTAERTMLRFGQRDLVRQFRQVFENEMTERLTSMVEEVTGRRVVNYQSQIMFDPDVIVEVFVFGTPGPLDARSATGHGLIADDDTGEATDETALGESEQ